MELNKDNAPTEYISISYILHSSIELKTPSFLWTQTDQVILFKSNESSQNSDSSYGSVAYDQVETALSESQAEAEEKKKQIASWVHNILTTVMTRIVVDKSAHHA